MAVLNRFFGSNGGDENRVARPSFHLARSIRQNLAEPGRTVLAVRLCALGELSSTTKNDCY